MSRSAAWIASRRGIVGMFGAMAALALTAGDAAAQTRVRFTLDWRFEGPAAIFTHGIDKGYFKAEGLDVTIDVGNGSREAIPRVASGTYEMGFGDINSLIRFRDQNPAIDVKAVMMIYDVPPFAIVGRKSRGVSADPKSLEGKKFGAPAADGAYAQWPIFREVNKLDEKSMKFENVGFPVREPMLASGEVDAIFGFSFSSYLNLKSRGTPENDIVMLLMGSYGVELYGNAIMVNPKFASDNPEAVKAFLRAIVKSAREVAADPAGAIDSVMKRNDVARKDVELERLKMVLDQNVVTPWVKANGYGGIDAARYARALDQIELTGKLKDRAKAGDAFTDAFLGPAAERKIN